MDRRKTYKLNNINFKLFQKFNKNFQEKQKEEEEEEDEEEEEEDNKDNFKRTKLNVIENRYRDNSPNNKGNNNQQNSQKLNFNNLKRNYKFQKRNIEIKSWNNINFANVFQLNNSNASVNELSLDPMEISEKICTELYSFLISVKIDNFNEKNCDINYLKDIAHSDTFDQLKDLILSLKNISIENL